MSKLESAEDFYRQRQINPDAMGQFNVFEMEKFCAKPMPYSRRDFYKVSFLKSKGRIMYAERGVDIDRPALMFSNPMTPYAWEPEPGEVIGYFCLFKEEFLKENKMSDSVQNSPLFRTGLTPIFFLDDKQVEMMNDLFNKMLSAIASDYIYKYDLLRNYLNLSIHEALQMRPIESSFQHKNASERITSLFLELLERQFPIDSPVQVLKLKSASDYAEALSVHVNHLNHSVKDITGKSTSAHIADRILTEAKVLLRYTDWPVSDIAFSLGFEYPTYFNNFFKKKTGHIPKSVRAAPL